MEVSVVVTDAFILALNFISACWCLEYRNFFSVIIN